MACNLTAVAVTLEEITGVPGYQYWTHDSRMLSLTTDAVMAALEELSSR